VVVSNFGAWNATLGKNHRSTFWDDAKTFGNTQKIIISCSLSTELLSKGSFYCVL